LWLTVAQEGNDPDLLHEIARNWRVLLVHPFGTLTYDADMQRVA